MSLGEAGNLPRIPTGQLQQTSSIRNADLQKSFNQLLNSKLSSRGKVLKKLVKVRNEYKAISNNIEKAIKSTNSKALNTVDLLEKKHLNPIENKCKAKIFILLGKGMQNVGSMVNEQLTAGSDSRLKKSVLHTAFKLYDSGEALAEKGKKTQEISKNIDPDKYQQKLDNKLNNIKKRNNELTELLKENPSSENLSKAFNLAKKNAQAFTSLTAKVVPTKLANEKEFVSDLQKTSENIRDQNRTLRSKMSEDKQTELRSINNEISKSFDSIAAKQVHADLKGFNSFLESSKNDLNKLFDSFQKDGVCMNSDGKKIPKDQFNNAAKLSENAIKHNEEFLNGSEKMMAPAPNAKQEIKILTLDFAKNACKQLDAKQFEEYRKNGTIPTDAKLKEAFEKFTELEATFGTAGVAADWNAGTEAMKMYASYL